MIGLEILPNSMLKNDNMRNIVKGLHTPKNYVECYNFEILREIQEKGSISREMLSKYSSIKDLFKARDDSTKLMFLQYNFVYEIEITKNDVQFRVLNDDIEKVKEIYKQHIPRIKFKDKVEDYRIELNNDMEVVEMVTKEHFMMSLGTTNRGLEPLKYILDIKRLLEEGERFTYQVILHPLDNEWTVACNHAYNEFKDGKYPQKFKINPFAVISALMDVGINITLETLYIFEELCFGAKNVTKYDITKDKVLNIRKDKGLSESTRQKSSYEGFEVNIRGIVSSKSSSRRDTILTHFKNCFSCMDGDNKLVMRNMKFLGKGRKNKILKQRIENRELIYRPVMSGKMILSSKEVESLLYLPQITLQREFNINKFDFYEVDTPKEVLQGDIPIGTIYGTNVMSYWSRVKDVLTLAKVIVGVKGSGKSKYFENYVYYAYKRGDCVIYFDYIENNQNAWEVTKHIPKEDVIIMDLSKGFTFNYPELDISNIPQDEEYMRTLRQFTSDYCRLIEKFINTINTQDISELTANMRNILTSACSFCFLTGNTDLYSIYKILTDHKFRTDLVKQVKEMDVYRNDDFRFTKMKELNVLNDKGKVVGTNNKADKVLDRFNALMRDSRTEEMLLGINRNVINFVEEFEKNKVILVLMPEDYFSDYELKDIVVTYFLTRMWLSGLKRAKMIPNRDDRKVVHIMLDEIHQLTNATKVMLKNIAEDRKFRTTYVFACQYLKQFGELWGAVKGTGCHYMLLAGAEKENFKMLSEEIGNNFTLDELINMPERHSLNIYRYNGQNITTYLSKLPQMLDVTMRMAKKSPTRDELEPIEDKNIKETLNPPITPKNGSKEQINNSFNAKYSEYLKKYKK